MTDVAEKPSKTRSLADFSSSLPTSGIPPEVVHGGKRALVDCLDATLAGSLEPATATLRDVVGLVATDSVPTIVGSGQRTTAPFASLANRYASHVFLFDDGFNP